MGLGADARNLRFFGDIHIIWYDISMCLFLFDSCVFFTFLYGNLEVHFVLTYASLNLGPCSGSLCSAGMRGYPIGLGENWGFLFSSER